MGAMRQIFTCFASASVCCSLSVGLATFCAPAERIHFEWNYVWQNMRVETASGAELSDARAGARVCSLVRGNEII